MTTDSLIERLEKRRDGAVAQAVAHSRNKQERESVLMHHKVAVWEQAIDIVRQHEADMGFVDNGSTGRMDSSGGKRLASEHPSSAPFESAVPRQPSEISVVDESELKETITKVVSLVCNTQQAAVKGMIDMIWLKIRPRLATREPVSLVDCAMALQGNERIKLGSDLQVIAKAVLDAAGVNYHED